ncbi:MULTISPECIES: hypothetical protein [unclassified Aureimonas]|uniref:hypothetical protein n=1 Tax=unclassified Aureimonas TaxID=2615206 RepID=UPI0006FEB932|nr:MULTISPECIES: hypothetical protein [unclassified Aureimonas]KQT57540.1 hypothetical protein ASG62_09530 [Aureimonas sp. Leaf427]KQT77221.1 hypothetical protein ASG54_13400 [Aureimonas sp. Leaf460]
MSVAAEPGSGLAVCAQCASTTKVLLTGAGTEAAKAVAEFTKGDVDRWCNGYVVDEAKNAQCKSDGEIPGGKLGERLTSSADCLAGKIVDIDGKIFTTDGIWLAGEHGIGVAEPGEIRFRDSNGEIEGSSRAGRGKGLIINYARLCPAGVAAVAKTSSKSMASSNEAAVDPATAVSLSSLSGNAYDHNGSQMRIDRDRGVIAYDDPKSSISGTVRSGQVLFRGKLPWRSMKASGTAFTFKKGCAPAPYKVTGYWTENQDLVLTGAAPKRAKEGCEVVGYSKSGGNSKLTFKSLMSD